MPEINCDVPVQEVWVDPTFLTDGDEQLAHCAHPDGRTRAVWFGVRSVEGYAVACRVLLENGAMFLVPVHALWHLKVSCTDVLSLPALELWDCPSGHVSAIEFAHLAGKAMDVRIGGQWLTGSYRFTLDWTGNFYADDAGALGHKDGHVIALDNGQFAIQPNNRLRVHDPAYIEPFTHIPPYRTNTRTWRVEGRRATTSDEYFYADQGEHR